MDGQRFDRWTRALAAESTTRRRALRGLAAGAAGALLLRLGVEPAAAACRRNGAGCDRGNQCCSGVCDGGNCRRAPHQGICTIQFEACNGRFKKCGGSNGNCECYVRTNGASFCGGGAASRCEKCNSDDDCVRKVGPGYYCVGCKGSCPVAKTACIKRC